MVSKLKVYYTSDRTTYASRKKISLIGKIHNTKRTKECHWIKDYNITNVKMVKYRSNTHTYESYPEFKKHQLQFWNVSPLWRLRWEIPTYVASWMIFLSFEFLFSSVSPSVSAAQSNFYLSNNSNLWF